jgi:hypothetical protein
MKRVHGSYASFKSIITRRLNSHNGFTRRGLSFRRQRLRLSRAVVGVCGRAESKIEDFSIRGRDVAGPPWRNKRLQRSRRRTHEWGIHTHKHLHAG